VKRVLPILFAAIYLILSIGVAKSTHFCKGKARHTSVFSFEAKKCACSKYNPTNNCCDDERELVQLKDDQTDSQSLVAPIPTYNLISEIFTPTFGVSEHKAFIASDLEVRPPPKVPIYQHIRSLII
jgi:hypothetical protein